MSSTGQAPPLTPNPSPQRGEGSKTTNRDGMTPPSAPRHESVLPAELLRLLDPQPGETWVDCTVGAGGHSKLLAERLLPGGRLIGLDQDDAMLALARPRLDGL